MINWKEIEKQRRTHFVSKSLKSVKRPSPYHIFKWGVANLDLNLFNEIKEKLDKEEIDKLNLDFFEDKTLNIFMKRDFSSFFALKESQKDLEPDEIDVGGLITLYWYAYMINRIFEKEKNNYSAEELCFLFTMDNLGKEIEIIHGAPENFPFEYKFEDLLDELSRKIYYLVIYLRELGFVGKPKGIIFRDKIEQFNELYKSYIIQRYIVILSEKEKDMKVHEAIIKQFKKLKIELINLENEKAKKMKKNPENEND